jgi:hypothetical protein
MQDEFFVTLGRAPTVGIVTSIRRFIAISKARNPHERLVLEIRLPQGICLTLRSLRVTRRDNIYVQGYFNGEEKIVVTRAAELVLKAVPGDYPLPALDAVEVSCKPEVEDPDR